ncbi:hypothetical protein BpHYR1_013690 [Brachionus plicatilis]|uniref:Uncharacterized protein n=1 Tax=Brachionus plicatilis TaxID=10195 RepID=A0A3M7RTF6_BRAPC|nr:hypothetical protein BpHYR1_013690 [Brachionus plicatilis]
MKKKVKVKKRNKNSDLKKSNHNQNVDHTAAISVLSIVNFYQTWAKVIKSKSSETNDVSFNTPSKHVNCVSLQLDCMKIHNALDSEANVKENNKKFEITGVMSRILEAFLITKYK